MIYIPIHVDAAEQLNRELYKLTQPDAIRNPENVSEFYCFMYPHSSIPFVALEFPEEETIPIHITSNTSAIQSLLTPFVAQNQITQQELDAITNNLQSLAGQRFCPADFVPSSWQQYVLTREQAINQGYIPAGD